MSGAVPDIPPFPLLVCFVRRTARERKRRILNTSVDLCTSDDFGRLHADYFGFAVGLHFSPRCLSFLNIQPLQAESDSTSGAAWAATARRRNHRIRLVPASWQTLDVLVDVYFSPFTLHQAHPYDLSALARPLLFVAINHFLLAQVA